LQEKIDKLEL